MLLKPDKLLSLTTSYIPISLICSTMKLFECVIEQRLRSYLEVMGFINKYQSGFRKAKFSDDNLFRLSQSVMESFNRGEHLVDAFLDVGKAFDNVWHNGLRYKSNSSEREWFSIRQNQSHGRRSTGFCPESLLFLIYVNDLPIPYHRQNSKYQFADVTELWAANKNVQFAVKLLVLLGKDLRKSQIGVPNGE